MKPIASLEQLTVLHWMLAYGGLLVHILLKLAEVKGSFLEGISRKEFFTFLSSVLLVPIILIICTDYPMKDVLPINYVTAFLTGYQTQSMMRSISKLSQKQSDN